MSAESRVVSSLERILFELRADLAAFGHSDSFFLFFPLSFFEGVGILLNIIPALIAEIGKILF